LVAVLSTVATGRPLALTVVDRPPTSMPVNGWGSGVGTSAGPAGTKTMWTSTATTWSFCRAIGLPAIS
jgi:hypothetical protein